MSGATTPEAATIGIVLNGKPREVSPGLSVRALLETLELKPETIVVEHNREILSRDRYDAVSVEAGDHLELVHFVGGG